PIIHTVYLHDALPIFAHPGDAGYIKWFNNHGINNYTANKMFDKDGYFIPDLLFDETLFGHPEKSPLAMKNDGMENFNIAIKTFIDRKSTRLNSSHVSI